MTPPVPLPYADLGNPQSLNKYAYVLNNPLRFIDPDGHSEKEEEALKKKRAAEEAKRKKEEQRRAEELERKSKVVFRETSGLVPQKAQDAAKNASPWNNKSYDLKSAAELKKARTHVADISERNKVVHSDSSSSNKIERQVYQDCRDATAGSVDQDMAGPIFLYTPRCRSSAPS